MFLPAWYNLYPLFQYILIEHRYHKWRLQILWRHGHPHIEACWWLELMKNFNHTPLLKLKYLKSIYELRYEFLNNRFLAWPKKPQLFVMWGHLGKNLLPCANFLSKSTPFSCIFTLLKYIPFPHKGIDFDTLFKR